MDLKEIFEYDDTSKTCLRWKIDILTGMYKHIKIVGKGDAAGTLTFTCKNQTRKNNVQVTYQGTRLLAHRIIWELFNGPIPDGMVIDHLNGDPWDNRIENLACKTNAQNQQNSKMHKSNTSGFKGVSFKYQFGETYARATVVIEGRPKEKNFSVNKYGLLPAFKMAMSWRLEKIKELNLRGAMYTERHLSN